MYSNRLKCSYVTQWLLRITHDLQGRQTSLMVLETRQVGIVTQRDTFHYHFRFVEKHSNYGLTQLGQNAC